MKRTGRAEPTPKRSRSSWRDAVASWTEELAIEPLRLHPEVGPTEIRQRTIVEVRMALDPNLGRRAFIAQFGGVVYRRAGGVLRQILNHVQLDWRQPIHAENVMGVVQRTLDLCLELTGPEPGAKT